MERYSGSVRKAKGFSGIPHGQSCNINDIRKNILRIDALFSLLQKPELTEEEAFETSGYINSIAFKKIGVTPSICLYRVYLDIRTRIAKTRIPKMLTLGQKNRLEKLFPGIEITTIPRGNKKEKGAVNGYKMPEEDTFIQTILKRYPQIPLLWKENNDTQNPI